MARLRSPGYPSFSLDQVIEFAKLIHEQDRQHPVPRDVAARHMGFSGPSGTADRALSALMHYALAEKVVKGEIRITDLALRAIHFETVQERKGALREAAFSPDLFKELRERYPDAPPSLASLSSYLSRENFAPAAIPSAAKAYLETCSYLQREGAYESGLDADRSGSESAEKSSTKESTQMQPPPASPTIQSSPSPYAVGYPNPMFSRRDVFTLGEDGEVVVTLPSTVTQATYDDLKDWLDLIGRKVQRRVAAPSQSIAEIKRNDEE